MGKFVNWFKWIRENWLQTWQKIITIIKHIFDLQAHFHNIIGELTSFIEHDNPFDNALTDSTNQAFINMLSASA